MRIKTHTVGDVVVVTPKGNMMGIPETEQFRQEIKKYLADDHVKFVIDLKGVKWMNSSGLGALISAFTSVKNKEGEMVITNVSQKIESIFMVTQLIKVFKHYDSVDAAVSDLS